MLSLLVAERRSLDCSRTLRERCHVRAHASVMVVLVVAAEPERSQVLPFEPSAIAEHAGQPAVYSGPYMKWY